MDEPEATGSDGEQAPSVGDERRTSDATQRRLAWLARRRRERSEERIADRVGLQWTQHLSQQLAQARAHRDEVPQVEPVVPSGRSNFSRAEVPYGVDLAAAWSWRFLVIVAAGWVVTQAVSSLLVIVVPVVVALLLAALAGPAAHLLSRVLPRGLSSLLVVVGILGLISVMVTFATQQVIDGFTDISEQVVEALGRIQEWLRDGPLNISDQQISDALQQAQELVANSSEQIVTRATEVGTTVGHVVAGFFIVLFALYFFMADGERIWGWVVRLFPRAAQSRADSSGRVAWLTLTQFVRATVLVAAVDAIGIMIVAAVLQVPFVGAIGVLVFLGAFVPIVGATLTGLVAVLVALVAQGPLVALFMLLGVVGVQQVESNLLQPFLLGRMVAIHPLGVLLAVAGGVLLAGVIGALLAVPLLACINSVAVHLSGHDEDEEISGALLTDSEEEQAAEAEGTT